MKFLPLPDFPIVSVNANQHELTDYESMLEETIAELQREKQVMGGVMDDLRLCGICKYFLAHEWSDAGQCKIHDCCITSRGEYCLMWKFIKENNPEIDLLDSPF